MFDSVVQFVRSYEWYEVLAEMAVIWLFVLLVFRFLRGTRGAGVIKGFAVLLVILTLTVLLLSQVSEVFQRLLFIYERFLGLLAIVLVVVFQPELRQAMTRLGHARLLSASPEEMEPVLDAVSDAVAFLSKSQFGAIIAIEQTVKLGSLTESGHAIDAHVSARLLESIFWPNSPLHDLGVVIRDERIVAANVQFPLAEEGGIADRYGSRHRAAVGLSLEADCIVVIVSEETGGISIAEQGRIMANIPREVFRERLAERLQAPLSPEKPPGPGDSQTVSPAKEVQA